MAIPTEKLSRDRKQVQTRIRRRAGNIERDAKIYFEDVYQKPIEEWDLAELAHGRPRNVAGHFAGRSPDWITPFVMREAKRRLMTEVYGDLAAYADQAIKVMVGLMNSRALDANGKPLVDAATRFKAAQYILDHIIGKPKAVFEVEASDQVKAFLAKALVFDDGLPAHPVVDGQFYETNEGDGEDDE